MWSKLTGLDIDEIETELFEWLDAECGNEEDISKEKIKAAVKKSGKSITKCFERKHFENFLGKKEKGDGKHGKGKAKGNKGMGGGKPVEEKQTYSKYEIFRILFDKIKPNSEFDIFLINKVKEKLDFKKMSLNLSIPFRTVEFSSKWK